jgi:hypothetical protein
VNYHCHEKLSARLNDTYEIFPFQLWSKFSVIYRINISSSSLLVARVWQPPKEASRLPLLETACNWSAWGSQELLKNLNEF